MAGGSHSTRNLVTKKGKLIPKPQCRICAAARNPLSNAMQRARQRLQRCNQMHQGRPGQHSAAPRGNKYTKNKNGTTSDLSHLPSWWVPRCHVGGFTDAYVHRKLSRNPSRVRSNAKHTAALDLALRHVIKNALVQISIGYPMDRQPSQRWGIYIRGWA